MSWRTVATVLIIVFVAMIVWATVAEPLVETGDKFQSISTSDNNYDTSSLIDGYISSWFDAVLLLIFGLLAWGTWRVVRRELTRGQL